MKFLLCIVLALSMPKGVPAPAFVCAGTCVIPFVENCTTVISDYNFSGTCCSLADNSTTGGCDLTIVGTTGDVFCDYIPKNWSCNPLVGCVDGDTFIQSENGTESCPNSIYNATMGSTGTIQYHIPITNYTSAPVPVTQGPSRVATNGSHIPAGQPQTSVPVASPSMPTKNSAQPPAGSPGSAGGSSTNGGKPKNTAPTSSSHHHRLSMVLTELYAVLGTSMVLFVAL